MKNKRKRRNLFFGFGMALLLFVLPASSLVSGQEEGGRESLDFSSRRLLVASEQIELLAEEEAVLNSYHDMYLLQFADEECTERAYRYYKKHAEYTEVDTAVYAAEEGEEFSADSPESDTDDAEEIQAEDGIPEGAMSEEENPFTQLEEALEEKEHAPEEEISYDIALIDTGADNAAGAVSLIGEETGDDNGHGNRMAECIYAQNPEAKILSIKALDSTGRGDVSAVYAAIEYAVTQNVRIINLSVSAKAVEENSVIERAVCAAQEKGILVVGAAGNDGADASGYVPGDIISAYIVGASDENGKRIDSSNYGASVDYYICAGNTSEAAALFSGWLSLHSAEEIPEILNQGFLFAADLESGEEEGPAWEPVSYPAVYHMMQDGFLTAATKTFYSVEGLGDGDMLYYHTDRKHPAYCIDHGKPNPDGTKYSSTSETNAKLGYVMFNGYPNTKWGLTINEAQFLTQVAVFKLTGVSYYSMEDGLHSLYWLWNHFWGDKTYNEGETPPEDKGNFQHAIDLVKGANKNATKIYGQYVTYWEASSTKYQRLITYSGVQQGKLTLIKSSADPSLTDNNSRYSLKGAKYTVYSDKACTEEVGVLTTKADGTTNTLTLHPGTYYIKETTASKGYRVTAGKITQIVKSDTTATVRDAEVPIPYTVSLSVKKKVTGNMGDRNKNFDFELHLSGERLSDALITYEKGEESGEVVLTEGVYPFSLTDGEEIFFRNIPAGISYSVTELSADKDGYTTTSEGETEGVLMNDASVVFTNDRNIVPTGTHFSLRHGLVLSAPAAFALAFLVLRRRRKKE